MNPDQLMTISVPEAARRIGVGRNLAYKMAREGTLPSVKCGRKLRVSVSALRRVIDGENHKDEVTQR